MTERQLLPLFFAAVILIIAIAAVIARKTGKPKVPFLASCYLTAAIGIALIIVLERMA